VRQDRASCCRKGGDPVSSIKLVRQSFQALRLGSSRQTGAAWQMELTRAVPQVAGEGGPVGSVGGEARRKRGRGGRNVDGAAGDGISISISISSASVGIEGERGLRVTAQAWRAVRQAVYNYMTWSGC
jgi:hypothetical protein